MRAPPFAAYARGRHDHQRTVVVSSVPGMRSVRFGDGTPPPALATIALGASKVAKFAYRDGQSLVSIRQPVRR
jgi:hypothetical protein